MNNDFLNNLQTEISRLNRAAKLVAVTKSVGIDETNDAINAGVSAIGENRVEDFEKKFPKLLPADSTGSLQVEKHFIGQVQSRKIKQIVALFDVIQSVGSIEHLQKIEKEAISQNKHIIVLLQFNISQEAQRGGFKPTDVGKIIAAVANIRHVKIIGVMGMASRTNDEGVVRGQFRLLKSIRDKLQTRNPAITELSMGMSNDYKIALEEGATMLRIGRALFSA